MKRLVVIVLSLALAASVLGFVGVSEQSIYFKISKSLQIFGELFRQLSNDYVDEIEPQEFVEAGIEGMLKHLDPYTTYIGDEEQEEVEILVAGMYGGLGIVTTLLDSTVTIAGITEGSPAHKVGLRVGDKIYKIDSTVVLSAGGDELRKFTRGKPGSRIMMKVLRSGRKDTLNFAITREEVTLKNVAYSGLIGDADNRVGYIRLERFTYSATTEMIEALQRFRKESPALKGIILDLRDNPGGLLDVAVSISELFVPPSSLIVSTRGRGRDTERQYFSKKTPMEPDIPLAVLINEHSASASEIVAGAVQDLDRGILLGERSFGKGLVQTITALPFGASLKMTTAKYYTPSGRCIQKIDYTERRHGIVKTTADTSKIFKTRNGRIVREATGIAPDTTISMHNVSPIVAELVKRNIIFRFANQYTGTKDSLPKNFTVTKALLNEFTEYLKRQGGNTNNPVVRKLADLETTLKAQQSSAALKHVESLKSLVSKEYFQELDRQREVLAHMVEREIIERFVPRSKAIASSLDGDIQVQAAVNILRRPASYKAMLGKQ
jgi:carboxyl-terminal processing protease